MIVRQQEKYEILLPQFEGPFDLLLFFVERDELDIYDIPIAKITEDFLAYINEQEKLNIELSSDFMLFASKLIHIKVRTLFPRKELDTEGNEIDPRHDFIQQLLAYKRFKQVASELAEHEANRMKMIVRGNLMQELNDVAQREADNNNSELQTLTMVQLMKAFEKVLYRLERKQNVDHVVNKFSYNLEECKEQLSIRISKDRKLSFNAIFGECENRVHAIFYFLAVLELIQLAIVEVFLGEGRNNFIVEYVQQDKVA